MNYGETFNGTAIRYEAQNLTEYQQKTAQKNLGLDTLPNTYCNILKRSVAGEIVKLDDVSPIEHDLKIKVSDSSAIVKIYGKNLLPYPYVETTKTTNGITFTDNGDGSITINGTTTTKFTSFMLNNTCANILKDGVRYATPYLNNYGITLYFQYKDENDNDFWGIGGFTWSNSYTFKQCYLQIGDSNVTFDNLTIYPQLEISETATEFEPYKNPVYKTPSETGDVSGVIGNGENMIITTDTDGATVTVEYNRDINKVIANLESKIAASTVTE